MRELLTGDDPSAMLSHRWKRSWPADGEKIFSNPTVVGGEAGLSLRRCLAAALQCAGRHLPGGAAPPAGIAPKVWPPHRCLGEATFFEG